MGTLSDMVCNARSKALEFRDSGYTIAAFLYMVRDRSIGDLLDKEALMAGHVIPHFQNDAGHDLISIGVKEFMCVGASPPFDHPHVYLDMGDETEIVCPYCSTLYRFDKALDALASRPEGALFDPAEE